MLLIVDVAFGVIDKTWLAPAVGVPKLSAAAAKPLVFNDILKNQCQIEHTRHRSFDNFISNVVSGLIAYSFLPSKPHINLNCERALA